MKRALLALMLVVIAAPAAMADHCVRCEFAVPSVDCVWGTRVGRTECDTINGVCQTFGDPCSHQTASAALASEFQVASVERIDEAPAPDEALVASLEAPQPTAEQR